ncbi:hypothetical protein ASPBRDRAFT_34067 [Aspergillus brasiliensis CBS 101740]|uniref:Uncharacterized protein n=1 Tax=Aspergillus brasiliensis (strain CBS 101740 / IMI 381727 / IBT 21946) TaxID=767769 RepID=A0A1L9U7U3_ASPBC|nr:hypothetical protein ASPBRDRAFT_34067 [Aspergillus brasiliensis CBS 101740]
MATPLYAHDLTRSPLPNLRRGRQTTTSDATHNLEYMAALVHWNTFEREVRDVFNSIQWGSQKEILAYAPPVKGNPNDTWHEQLFCGDEHSTLARFNQNVGHVMTSVFQSLGYSARFGDFKACRGTTIDNKVPDVVLLDETGRLRVVGEAKTPWAHDLEEFCEGQKSLRHCLGQLARYLYVAKITYGFLTTYDETIFVKQALHPDKKKSGQMTLWYSNLIKHHTPSTAATPGSSHMDYRGKVSLRECFLFLGKMTSTGASVCVNNMKSANWVDTKGKKKYDDSDHISPSVSSSEDSSDGERGRSRPPPPPPAAGQSQHWQSLRPPAQPPSNATSQSRSQSRSSAAATHQLALRPRDSQRPPQHPAPTALSAASQSRSQSRPPAPSTYQVTGQAQASQPRHLAPTAPSAASQSRSRSRPPAPSTQQVMSQASSVHSQSHPQSRPVTRSQTQGQLKAPTTKPSNEPVETVYEEGAGKYYYLDATGKKRYVNIFKDESGQPYVYSGKTRRYVTIKKHRQ